MSRRIHGATLALAPDGTVFVGLAQFGGASPEELLRRALEEDGEVFVGVALSAKERSRAALRVDNAAAEAAAYVIGKRQRRRRATTRRR
jgi:hypothetical protein